MCISPLTLEELETLGSFHYSSTNESITYNYIISPLLNKLVLYIPKYIAPNLITLLSLFFNFLSLYITILDIGDSYDDYLNRITCLFQFIFHFFYYIADNLDGKQARRTKTSSAYGMLLDHGCDSITTIIVCFNMSHLLILGKNGFFSPLMFISLLSGFYFITYRQYYLDDLYFGFINAADEGNLVIVILSFFGFIFGGKFYLIEIFGITIGKWIAFFTFIMAIFSAFISSFYNIYSKKGINDIIIAFKDLITFYHVLIYPYLFNMFNKNFYYDYFTLIMILISLLFATQTIDLQINIVINKKLKYSISSIIVNILMLFSYFIKSEKFLLIILTSCIIILLTELMLLVVIRSLEILNFLDIKLIKLKPSQLANMENNNN